MALLTFFMMDDLIGDWSEIDGSFGKLYVFFTEDMFPPDWSVLEAERDCSAIQRLDSSVLKLGKEYLKPFKWHLLQQ